MNKLINKSVSKLVLIESLLNEFHEQGINYCHWKSNEHLDASMAGDTDLDILFDEKEKAKLEILLDQLGFKKFNSINQKQYKDIEDFIGLDIQSGKVIHVHAHFRLTMGETYLKGYQLDLEEKLLGTRYFCQDFGIYCSNPAFELILLFIREALKLRKRDIIAMHLLNEIEFTGNILSEYNWLKQKITESQIEAILKIIFSNNYQPIYKLIIGIFNRKELLKLSYLLNAEFKNKRLYSPIVALSLRWYRETTVKLSRKSANLMSRPIISQRINPRGGIIIAVIGADGSGKSTVISNLQDTFKSKLDVYKIYYGRGDGKISLPRQILVNLKKIAKHSHNNIQIEKNSKKKSLPQNGLIVKIYKCIEALLVAYEKLKNLQMMQAAKKKGMLVICDRYPQNQLMGYNDGPLLHHYSKSKNPIFRAISKMESKIYDLADNLPPDTLFKLIADAKVVEARKPGETTLEVLESKIAGIKNLKFKENCTVITVDATQPLENVLFTIKREIWNNYP